MARPSHPPRLDYTITAVIPNGKPLSAGFDPVTMHAETVLITATADGMIHCSMFRVPDLNMRSPTTKIMTPLNVKGFFIEFNKHTSKYLSQRPIMNCVYFCNVL
jgi:hypothetical protein